MPKFIDLTGQKFNRWTVIERAENQGKSVCWLCECECGTRKIVRGGHLKSGASQSCGCLKREVSAAICKELGSKNNNHLEGQRFGDWTVLKDSGKRYSNGSIIWTCQCKCGTIKDIESRYLINHISLNCGCERINSKGENKIIELLKQYNIPFETQKTFESCRFPDTNRLAKFDFYVNNQYIIEYDGELHYQYSTGWATKEKMEKIQEHDEIKIQWCKDNNIPLIRIPYTKYETLCIQDLILDEN